MSLGGSMISSGLISANSSRTHDPVAASPYADGLAGISAGAAAGSRPPVPAGGRGGGKQAGDRGLPAVTGLVLAGGRSRRMGADKAMLPLGGRPVIEHVVYGLARVCRHVFIVSDGPNRYGGRLSMDVKEIYDRLPGSGPLAGLQAGMMSSPTDTVILAGCDMPFISPRVLKFMLAAFAPADARPGTASAAAARNSSHGCHGSHGPTAANYRGPETEPASAPHGVVPEVGGRLQPLHAVYHRRLLGPVNRLLSDIPPGGRTPGLMELIRQPDVHIQPFRPGGTTGVTPRQLEMSAFNMNTPEDHRRARHMYGERP